MGIFDFLTSSLSSFSCVSRDKCPASLPKSLFEFPSTGAAAGTVSPSEAVASQSNPRVPNVNFERIMEHCVRAMAAYSDADDIVSGELDFSVDVYPANSKREVFCVDRVKLSAVWETVQEAQGAVHWIAIQGVSNMAEAQELLQAALVQDAGLNLAVHSGALRLYNDLYELFTPKLKSLQKNDKIRITGHSLGGVLASLLCLRFKIDGLPIEECVTFGAPKSTGTPDKCPVIASAPVLRIINEHDPAPRAPPLPGFSHWGIAIILKEGNDFDWCCSPGAESGLGGLLAEGLVLVKNLQTWSEHYPDRYIHLLLPWCKDLPPQLRRQLEVVARPASA